MENIVLLHQQSSPPVLFKSLNLVLNHEIFHNMLVRLGFNFNSTEEALFKRITISQGNQEITLNLLGLPFP